MAGLFADAPLQLGPRNRVDLKLLHQMQCRACPLDKLAGNRHPHMPASGSDKPLVYILGEAPGKDEDIAGRQFVGESGQVLRPRIPRKFKDRVRFNNVVRTRPFKNETPTDVAIECCRPSVVKDIEETKPKAIFGFGNVPLEWVSGFSGITLWRGRKMPVKIGTHTCWFYPMLHPAYLLRQGRGEGKTSGAEDERMFVFDLERAFAEVETLPKPVVHTSEDVWRGMEAIVAGGAEGVRIIAERLHRAAEWPELGIDYETTRLRPYSAGAQVLSAAVADGEQGFAFPLDHPEAEWNGAERTKVVDLWRQFLHEAKGRRWVHNLAFELEWTAVHFGKEFVRKGEWEDTSVQASILDERRGKNKPGCFSLEFLVQQHFGFNLKKLTALDRKNLKNAPMEIVLLYNGGDSRYHCLLGLKQEQLIADDDLGYPYELALRRVPTVVLSQLKGVPVDQVENKRLSKKYAARIRETQDKLFDLPVVAKFEKIKGREFKPLSNPDVLYVLKDLLHRSECAVEDKYSKKTRYSADEKILAQIDHPFAKLTIDLRKSTKRKSTYIDPYSATHESSVVHPDGLLHPQFNTIFAETGRLSAEDPNLQNVPKRDDEAKEVRKQIAAAYIISSTGKRIKTVIGAFDFGQIEARVSAMFTKDPVFVKALWEKYDIHGEWAERIARAYPARVGGRKNFTDKKVMKDFRTDIKNQWTFPLIFGARLESVAGYLDIPIEDLEPEFNEFWRIFHRIKEWQDDLVEFYHEYGYVECLTKRRRRGPLSLNQIINSPIQGTAAEIVMDAMSRLSEIGDPELQPEINIHDDLTYVRMPADRIDDVAEKIINEMLAVPFKWVNVPISVEMSVGDNWLDMEEVATFSSDTWFK
jgi:uracil-DNA glycosylase family 4